MRDTYVRVAFAGIVAVVLSMGLYIYLIQSPFVLVPALALGCYLARVSTIKDGLWLGWVTTCPLAFYRVWLGFMPADSDEGAVVLNGFILIVCGAIYGGAITWLIQHLKGRKVYLSQ